MLPSATEYGCVQCTAAHYSLMRSRQLSRARPRGVNSLAWLAQDRLPPQWRIQNKQQRVLDLGRSTVRKHRDEAGASAPAPKRRAELGLSSEGTLLVRDTHYQIKGLCSFLHDMQCYICQNWDGESMWHLKCRNIACSHLGYICAICS
jgi:hypothetical protein